MIANVSPSIQTFEDTRNTLAYANRAKNIKTSVQRNVVSVQYHISNYDQIIKNLKTEIQELKTQLAKKDFSVNNIVPAKQELALSKKLNEELKDPLPKQITNGSNSVNNIYFEKAVAELKSHCEEELVLKQKIIDQEQEMNNLNTLINKKKIDFINNSANNIFNSLRLNTNTDLGINMLSNNNINSNQNNNNLNINLNDDLTTNLNLNLDDKEILINPNQNNSLISNIPTINPSVNNNNEAAAQQKELETKMQIAKKNWEKNFDKFKEMQKKREALMHTYNKNGIKDFHYEYLQSIIKAHNLKIFIIENRFKEKFNYVISEVKENYISVLEGQLKIRDDLIKNQHVALPADDSDKFKSLDQIKNEFSNKLPLILNHKIVKDPNASLDLNFSSISSNNLPPINRNVNNLLSEIKSVNTNISRIDNNLNNYNNNNFNLNSLNCNGNNGASYRNRLKSEYAANLIKLENQNKRKYTKNYSQGVRNLNMAMLANNSNPNVNSGGNLNTNLNINNNISNINNINNSNQRIQQSKLLALANKNPKRSKNFDLNLINQKQREAQSEKSDSHNLSREYDSYVLDLDNSKDDSQIKKLKQQIRERKSAQLRSHNLRDESGYSPVRKGIPSQMRKDYESIPAVKKKDLNNFLVERNKIKNLRKNVFKI